MDPKTNKKVGFLLLESPRWMIPLGYTSITCEKDGTGPHLSFESRTEIPRVTLLTAQCPPISFRDLTYVMLDLLPSS